MSVAAAARCPLAQRAKAPSASSTSYTRRPGLPGGLPARRAVPATHPKQQPRLDRQLRLPALSGSSGGSSGGDGENVFARALQEYDGFIEQSLKTVEEGRTSLKELDDELVRMRADGVLPNWLINTAVWSRRLGQEGVVESQKRYDALRAKRAEFAAALRQLEAEQAQQVAVTGTAAEGEEGLAGADGVKAKMPNSMTADVLALTGYTWAQAQEDGEDLGGSDKLAAKLREALDNTSGPNSVLWVCVSSCLLTAWLAGLAGGWAGYDAYRLLHEAPSPQVAAAWLGWTAPYVLGTLAANSAAPGVLNKSIFRPLTADQRTFFRKMPILNFAACAAIVSFCQCLTYQGLWQDVFTALLGGVRDPLLDPQFIDQPVMGSLVGGRLPAFVVAPSAAVLTGTLEAAFYFSALALRDTSTTIILGSDKMEAKDWLESPWGSLEETNITADDRLLICARVALAGTYLALETTLTGNLWFAVGTSTAGMITSVLLSQRAGGAKRA